MWDNQAKSGMVGRYETSKDVDDIKASITELDKRIVAVEQGVRDREVAAAVHLKDRRQLYQTKSE